VWLTLITEGDGVFDVSVVRVVLQFCHAVRSALDAGLILMAGDYSCLCTWVRWCAQRPHCSLTLPSCSTCTDPSCPAPVPPAAVPVGVGSEGSLTLRSREMDLLLQRGMAYTEELGLSWPQDREVTEEQVGCCCVLFVFCLGGGRGDVCFSQAW
jgi:hypothetical protein